MGIFSGLIGNAAETDIDDVKKDYGKLLGQNEQVIQAYKWVRDLLIFTDYRLILVDIQGGSDGKKGGLSFHSL